MLRVENIKKSFGGVEAIKGSSFSAERGQVTALIGPNGAGKTTLFDIITGLVTPDNGNVWLEDKNLTKVNGAARATAGLSRTFQQVRLFPYLTIADHLQLAAHYPARAWQAFKPTQLIPINELQIELHRFGIDRPLDARVSDLSYGQRKLLNIAMALRQPHRVLLLDEPVAGVNSVVQNRIEELLLELKTKGETMLVIDHDMQFVRRLADQVIALDAGVVVAEGTPDTVLNNPAVIESYLGT